MISVAPVNAVVTNEMFSLINSKGEALSDITLSTEAYDGLSLIHIWDGTQLPVSGECILGIHQMATDAHAQTEPDRTEAVRNLPQAAALQLEHRRCV